MDNTAYSFNLLHLKIPFGSRAPVGCMCKRYPSLISTLQAKGSICSMCRPLKGCGRWTDFGTRVRKKAVLPCANATLADDRGTEANGSTALFAAREDGGSVRGQVQVLGTVEAKGFWITFLRLPGPYIQVQLRLLVM